MICILGVECDLKALSDQVCALVRGFFPARSQNLHIALVLRKRIGATDSTIYLNVQEAKALQAKAALIAAQLIKL